MYITPTELARQYSRTLQSILNWMAQTPGLTPRKVGRSYLLPQEDVARILARPRKKMGRPKKTA